MIAAAVWCAQVAEAPGVWDYDLLLAQLKAELSAAEGGGAGQAGGGSAGGESADGAP
jgi:hypothetical protein